MFPKIREQRTLYILLTNRALCKCLCVCEEAPPSEGHIRTPKCANYIWKAAVDKEIEYVHGVPSQLDKRRNPHTFTYLTLATSFLLLESFKRRDISINGSTI